MCYNDLTSEKGKEQEYMLKRWVAFLLCVLLAFPQIASAEIADRYMEGQTLLAQGEYQAAAVLFDTLGSYEEAPLLAMYCKAIAQAELGNYPVAIQALHALDDYKDCRLRAIYYTARMYEDAAGETDCALMEQAHETYASIPLYLDSLERSTALKSKILHTQAAALGRLVIRDEHGERLSTATLQSFAIKEDGGAGDQQVTFLMATTGLVEAVRILDAQGNEIPLTSVQKEAQSDDYTLWAAASPLPDGYEGALEAQMLEAGTWISGGQALMVYVHYVSGHQYESVYGSVAELKAAGEALVREVEGEGIVLLKNENNTLPLPAGSELSLIGATVLDPVYGGPYSGAVDAAGAPNYLGVLEGEGYVIVNKPLLDVYVEDDVKRSYAEIGEKRWGWIKRKAKDEDGEMTIGNGEHVIFVVGRVGGEGNDLTGEIVDDAEDYLTLNEAEIDVLENLAELKADGDIASITVIINSANPISVGFLHDEAYDIDAALWVGSVGQTGLYAVGDVITGRTNPSGSLPDTWWIDNQLNPVQSNFGAYNYISGAKGLGNSYNKYVVYQEGVYLGYKYTETRYEDVVMGTPNAGDYNWSDVVAYPFGYGLSYTTFALTDMRVSKETRKEAEVVAIASAVDKAAARTREDTVYTITVTVTNTGSTAGKKTVQVYAQKPYTEYDRQWQIEKASVELVGYAKTDVLQPGESRTVTITVPEYYLTSYDALNSGVYVLAEGAHYLTVADNAHEAVNNILAVKGFTTADGMTAAGNAALVCSIDYTFDARTYAAAYGTGGAVTSLFDEADINRYEGRGDNSVVYYSRSNWAGTVNRPVILHMTPQMAADVVLDDSDLPDATGVSWPDMGEQKGIRLIHMINYGYDDPAWDEFLDQLTYEELAKICAIGLRMTVDVASIDKPRTLDHNGSLGMTQRYSTGPNGYATRTNDPDKDLRGTCFPCNGIVAATFNNELVVRVGELVGEDCMWAGYAGIYGTGLNIHRSPYAGRVFEYFSEDGILTGLMGTAWTLGVQEKGVYVYNKHFVLNDQENNRAGIGTWINEQALREIYLRAFELPIVHADAKCIMTAYNRLGPIWAGAYSDLLTNWLRGEAGMDGFCVTDMYDKSYMVKVHEVLAGNDIPDDYVSKLDEFTPYGPGGARANPLVAQALRASAKRVLYTVLHSRGMTE